MASYFWTPLVHKPESFRTRFPKLSKPPTRSVNPGERGPTLRALQSCRPSSAALTAALNPKTAAEPWGGCVQTMRYRPKYQSIRTPFILLCGLALPAFYACGVASDFEDETRGIVGSLGTSPDAPTTSLQNIQDTIFSPSCATAQCHDSVTRAGSLDLTTADLSYQQLVGRTAENGVAQANGWQLVKPYEPDLSFLVRKMEQPGIGEGAPMPIGQYEINQPYVNRVRFWIEEGAPR